MNGVSLSLLMAAIFLAPNATRGMRNALVVAFLILTLVMGYIEQ